METPEFWILYGTTNAVKESWNKKRLLFLPMQGKEIYPFQNWVVKKMFVAPSFASENCFDSSVWKLNPLPSTRFWAWHVNHYAMPSVLKKKLKIILGCVHVRHPSSLSVLFIHGWHPRIKRSSIIFFHGWHFRLRPCAFPLSLSVLFIHGWHPRIKKSSIIFFHGCHFYPWMRFSHPWIILTDKNFIHG